MDDDVPQSASLPTSALPLRRFPVFHSTDPAVLAELLSTRCGASDFDFREGPRPFEVTINYLELKQIALVSCRHQGAAGFRLPTNDRIHQPFCISGTGVVDVAGQQFRVNREETCVLPSRTETLFNHGDEQRSQILRRRGS
jgi:AraC-like protein